MINDKLTSPTFDEHFHEAGEIPHLTADDEVLCTACIVESELQKYAKPLTADQMLKSDVCWSCGKSLIVSKEAMKETDS